MENPEQEQTQPRPGGRAALTAPQLIGFAYHHDAWADDETPETFPQQVYAEINVEAQLYQDAWHWARSGNLGTASLWLEVFGKGMKTLESYGASNYEWLFNENDYEQLYVCGFAFNVGSKAGV